MPFCRDGEPGVAESAVRSSCNAFRFGALRGGNATGRVAGDLGTAALRPERRTGFDRPASVLGSIMSAKKEGV